MPYLIVICIVLGAANLVLKRILSLRMQNLRSNFHIMRRHYEELEAELKELKSVNQKIESAFQRKLALFEITKLISKSLNQKEVFSIFKKNISQLIEYQDCYFLDPAQIAAPLPNVTYFTLKNERGILGNLAVKGLMPQDKNIMAILVVQLNLVLKKISLFDEVQQLSITDSLTQVFNRRHLLHRFNEEFKRSLRYKFDISVMMIDIDFFKACNDRFGHLVGDVVLREAADLIKQNIRATDFLGRYGGEEFLVVLPESNKDAAYIVGQRIHNAVRKYTIHAYDEEVSITLSIGLASLSSENIKAQELIDRADFTMYRAKKTGRDKICVYNVYK